LIQKTSGKGDKAVLQLSGRAKEYSDLNATEEYFFLLETLWVDTNWKHIEASIFKGLGILNIQNVLVELAGKAPHVPIRAKDLLSMPESLGYFWIYFSLFGFWTVTQNKEIAPVFKRSFYPEIVTPLLLGITLAQLLVRDRNYVLWNLPFRRELGEWKVNPGQPLPQKYLLTRGAKKGRKPRIVQRDQSREPFFLSFAPLFSEEELRNTLPRDTAKEVDGVYLFRVALSKGVWRKIELSSNHTLLDLHSAIQDAFQFDSDHLYSFFMDGIPWSDEKFSSPYEDEGPHVDEVRIGELGLTTGQTILYLFDYGDEWHFHVTIEEIQQGKPLPKKPRMVESQGKSPEQYPDWEE
jgi:shikimate kinase